MISRHSEHLISPFSHAGGHLDAVVGETLADAVVGETLSDVVVLDVVAVVEAELAGPVVVVTTVEEASVVVRAEAGSMRTGRIGIGIGVGMGIGRLACCGTEGSISS